MAIRYAAAHHGRGDSVDRFMEGAALKWLLALMDRNRSVISKVGMGIVYLMAAWWIANTIYTLAR